MELFTGHANFSVTPNVGRRIYGPPRRVIVRPEEVNTGDGRSSFFKGLVLVRYSVVFV